MTLSCCKKCLRYLEESKTNGDLYFLNCLYSFRTEKKTWKAWTCINIFTYKCLRKGKSILKYKHGEKSMKVPFMVYVNILLQKIDIGYSNPENN